MYTLIKTHKLPSGDGLDDTSQFKVRLIISNVGGPTDRISWLLNLVLVQLLRLVPAHLADTCAFLAKLREANVEGCCVMESFDVTSLYTNVSRENAMQAVNKMLGEYKHQISLYVLSIAQIMTFVDACLQCNIFKWSNECYRQIRRVNNGSTSGTCAGYSIYVKNRETRAGAQASTVGILMIVS